MPVVHVSSEAEFNKETKKKNLTVVDFFATWCGPCKMIEEPLEALSAKYPHVKFLKVDVDKLTEVSAACGVKAMPTLQLFKAGLMIREIVGADLKSLESAIIENANVQKDAFGGSGRTLGGPVDANAAPQPTGTAASSVTSFVGGLYNAGSSVLSAGAGVVSSVAGGVVNTLSGGSSSASSAAPIVISQSSKDESPEAADADCEIQFRFRDGQTVRRKFRATDTVADARKFIAGRLPSNYAFRLVTSYPRRFYEGPELQKTLQEEKLSPRGQLIVEPTA